MGLVLNGSVGKGPRAQNMPVDVSAVEEVLKARCDGESGIVGTPGGGTACAPQTVAAIIAYQKQVLKLPFPDGLIMPGGTTHNFLIDPKRRWQGLPKSGADKPGDGNSPTQADLPPIDQGAAELDRRLPDAQKAVVGQFYRDNVENWIKGIGGGLGRAEDFRVIALFIYYCNKAGFNTGQIVRMFNIMRKLPPADFKIFVAMLEPATKFGRVIAAGAKVGEGLGIAAMAIDVYIYGKNGDWGAAIGEVYKFAMNKAVPWAGMIEGLQSLLDALPLGDAKKALLFKVVRFIDPVGLGGSAFDSIVSLGRFIMSKDPTEGERILNQAIKRLEVGPTGILKVPGEMLGDFVYHLINDPGDGKWAERMDRMGPKY